MQIISWSGNTKETALHDSKMGYALRPDSFCRCCWRIRNCSNRVVQVYGGHGRHHTNLHLEPALILCCSSDHLSSALHTFYAIGKGRKSYITTQFSQNPKWKSKIWHDHFSSLDIKILLLPELLSKSLEGIKRESSMLHSQWVNSRGSD